MLFASLIASSHSRACALSASKTRRPSRVEQGGTGVGLGTAVGVGATVGSDGAPAMVPQPTSSRIARVASQRLIVASSPSARTAAVTTRGWAAPFHPAR